MSKLKDWLSKLTKRTDSTSLPLAPEIRAQANSLLLSVQETVDTVLMDPDRKKAQKDVNTVIEEVAELVAILLQGLKDYSKEDLIVNKELLNEASKQELLSLIDHISENVPDLPRELIAESVEKHFEVEGLANLAIEEDPNLTEEEKTTKKMCKDLDIDNITEC